MFKAVGLPGGLITEAEEVQESTGSSASKLRWDDTRVNFQNDFFLCESWKASSILGSSCSRWAVQTVTGYMGQDSFTPMFHFEAWKHFYLWPTMYKS